ncbi:MAG: type II secretion system protein [Candidatus Omnitrophota bacterium]
MRKLSGFTLIELLITIAVLGILVAFILPRFADIRNESNARVCVTNLRGIAQAMTVYEQSRGFSVDWDSYTVADLVNWGFLAKEPFCPFEPKGGTDPSKNDPYILKKDPIPHAECPDYHIYDL